MQELITTFIALNFSQFNDGGGKVQQLMYQYRDFAEDVLDKVRTNMTDTQDQLKRSIAFIAKGCVRCGGGVWTEERAD